VKENRKTVVGLTGRYCSGKGSAARVFASLGFAVVDADELSHDVMAEKAKEIISVFGPSARAKDGRVDRRTLGRIIFKDPVLRTRLEGILYPSITERIFRFIDEAQGSVVINAPLLQRAGLEKVCTAVVFVRAPALVRLIRAMRRDALSLRDAWARINAQRDVSPQSIRTGVDTYSVLNCSNVRSFERRIARLARRLKV
jgi:dephospho-CoA kinase